MDACELEASQVAAFLDEVLHGDLELRRKVESLLAHHIPATIVTAAAAAAATTPGVFRRGTVMAGRYRHARTAGPRRHGRRVPRRRLETGPIRGPEVPLAWTDRMIRPGCALQNEVRLARKVTHPNVLRVYDLVEADGEVFIAMEYVDGEDLSGLLRRMGRLTAEKGVEIARQLCGGLGAAHDRGVLHRDLKPANIMIDGRGQARIADFGIAALTAHASRRGQCPARRRTWPPSCSRAASLPFAATCTRWAWCFMRWLAAGNHLRAERRRIPSREIEPPRLSEAAQR